MKMKTTLFTMLLLSVMTLAFAMQPIYSQGGPDGPQTDNLLCHIYLNPDAENYALEAGEIDITDWPLTNNGSTNGPLTPTL
jgi:hypothetical protein